MSFVVNTKENIVNPKGELAHPWLFEGDMLEMFCWLTVMPVEILDNLMVAFKEGVTVMPVEILDNLMVAFLKGARMFLDDSLPMLFVPQYYAMNPKTEDLLPNGWHLSNGMVVLPESSDMRPKTGFENNEVVLHRMLQNSRWCTVTHVEVLDGMVNFVGVYDDGTKRKQSVNVNRAWFVKLDSIDVPTEQEPETDAEELRGKIDHILREELQMFYRGLGVTPAPKGIFRSINKMAEEITIEILGLL